MENNPPKNRPFFSHKISEVLHFVLHIHIEDDWCKLASYQVTKLKKCTFFGNAPICTLYIVLQKNMYTYTLRVCIYIYIFFFPYKKPIETPTQPTTRSRHQASKMPPQKRRQQSPGGGKIFGWIWLLGLIANRWLTTTNLSYTFPILETSAPCAVLLVLFKALCLCICFCIIFFYLFVFRNWYWSRINVDWTT